MTIRKKALAEPTGRPHPEELDRVWVGLTRKYRVVQYESLEVNIGSTVSVYPGEGTAEAIRRVFAEVKGEYDDVITVMREEEGI